MSEEATRTAVSISEEEAALERGRPFRALYEHWERNQWSPLELDLSTDAASFAALDREAKRGLIWIFAHRFHAEFKVATLLAPFLEYAPDWDVELVIATQIADEHRHLQSVLRVYDEVLGVKGGIEAARALADQNADPIASGLYDALEGQVAALARSGDEDAYLRASVSYHLLGEGVVASCAQHLASGQYERFGSFPGLTQGQKLVARDEARHIGIGVSYARRCLAEDRERAAGVIMEVIDGFGELAAELYGTAVAGGMGEQVVAGYGVEPEGFYQEGLRLLRLRLRSIGLSEDED